MNGMVAVAIVLIVIEITVEDCGLEFAVTIVGQCDNLMLGELDGTSFMNVDMTGTDTENAFILIEHGVDGGGVGLRSAGKEENLSIGQTDGLTNKVLGVVGVGIEAVGGGTGVIMTDKGVEYKWMSAVVVVAFER